MRRRVPIPTLLTALALLLTFPAASPAGKPLAKIENAGEALLFHPIQEAESFTLVVSGPLEYHYEVKSDEAELVFKLDEETVDGSYTYSLTATPYVDPKVRKMLRAAREAGDKRAVRRLKREGKLPDAEALSQTGGFTVVKGRIVIAEKKVPESERRSDQDEEG